ncbi:EH domain-containing protein 1 [Camelus dromedarius]|uniref:EH domain-containing protein 1 n=1 Tax=Camelus dromedarius TaxID=9838 RepID=A0A5N4C813_CAMDR|nr:EH domain-containing protein 1 [Camelus dromedarius]
MPSARAHHHRLLIAVMHGPTEGMVPGNRWSVDPRAPSQAQSFATLSSPVHVAPAAQPGLGHISIIDTTPGILYGENALIRGYDSRPSWSGFADGFDRIILLFDAHKLDISDDFSEA